MVHLPALLGSPGASLPLEALQERAVGDARTLVAGGVDALIIENFNDVPFRSGSVEPHTVAAMTRVALAVRGAVTCPIGINVLRNDALAALGIALASGANFIRVNIHTGAMLTDQGVITGRADETLRVRAALRAEHIGIFADVLVKHAVALGPLDIASAVEDTVLRGLADAVIVSGTATGKPASLDDVRSAVSVAAGTPVYIGSGVSAANVGQLVPPAEGVIVGSSLKAGGDVHAPVDEGRVRELRRALDDAIAG